MKGSSFTWGSTSERGRRLSCATGVAVGSTKPDIQWLKEWFPLGQDTLTTSTPFESGTTSFCSDMIICFA